jgi:hypothetical protein
MALSNATKKEPHPELVEGRTMAMQNLVNFLRQAQDEED